MGFPPAFAGVSPSYAAAARGATGFLAGRYLPSKLRPIHPVIPAKAGIFLFHTLGQKEDSRFRGNDGVGAQHVVKSRCASKNFTPRNYPRPAGPGGGRRRLWRLWGWSACPCRPTPCPRCPVSCGGWQSEPRRGPCCGCAAWSDGLPPAFAGVSPSYAARNKKIPAFAGMTGWGHSML